MSDREKILARIRDALRAGLAPKPGAHGDHGTSPSAALEEDASNRTGKEEARAPKDFVPWLPPTGSGFDAHATLFARNATELKADFRLLDDDAALSTAFAGLVKENGWKRLVTHAGVLNELALADLTGSDSLQIVRTDGGYRVAEMESCDAGLTECEALVAQTGSVLITSRSSGGRAASVLPPHHVVVARASQMVADLPAAFALLARKYAATDYPSLISFITGPSRTGDIERILVLGAHGPKQLTILCVR
jgi:L-lactate dehydrogenase complex protein LldG